MSDKHTEVVELDNCTGYLYYDKQLSPRIIILESRLDFYYGPHFVSMPLIKGTEKRPPLEPGFYEGAFIRVTTPSKEFCVFKLHETYAGDPISIDPIDVFTELKLKLSSK